MATRTVDLGKVVGPAGPAGPNEVSSSTDTALNGVLFGNGSKVGAKALDTSSLTNDADHVPTSGAVKSALDALAPANYAGAHNSIYRGKSLGSSVTTAQWNAISAGTFDDLFIGDYWTIPVTISGTTKSINWRIAAFDYWLNTGETECTTHHVVLVPDSSLYDATINDEPSITGAYVGSKMYTTNLAAAKTAINSAFGSSHILSHQEQLTNAVSGSAPSGWAWYNSTVELMNEAMVYGTTAWGAHDGNGYNVGIDKSQLPLFALEPNRITTRSNWWLRDIASSVWARVGNYGQAFYLNASVAVGVRPVFAIKA